MNKTILKRKINFITQPIVNYLFKKNHQRVNRYAKYHEKYQVEKNTILYESRDGNSLTDSPYAIFKYMLVNPGFKDFVHIWSISDFNELSNVISKYRDFPNVKFVKRNSKKYLKYLASCQYLINNSTFQSFFIPKSNQTYINTWHGTPLKSMGFDIPGNPSSSQNVVRNFLSADYILSPNAHTTKIFTESYKLDGLFNGTIIEEGYPRIDLTLNTNPQEFKNELRGLGLKVDDNKENILYAPTWKGTNLSKANNDVLQIIADISYLEQETADSYNILVKVHPFIYKEASKHKEISSKLIPDFIDTNELLSTIDLLITDYSSVFFDFLVTNRPILFYTWDADVYSEQRGQYLKNEELPGPILYNSLELAAAIKNIETTKEKFQNNYKKMQKKFTNYEDGSVTKRVVQYVFNKMPTGINTITNLDTHKKKILIYPGGLMNNGITSSFINLMNNIDFDKYDVSCFTATPHSKEVLKNLERVNKKVRFLFKPGLPVYKISEIYRDKYIHNRGIRGFFGDKLFPELAYYREHLRLFGKSKFDYVIDFSGYSLYWAKYLIVSKAKAKICFMHNDLLSDSERLVNGRRPHRINLRGLFTLYNRFDKLVSVSKGTMELNRQNLLEYADFNKFDFVLNSINPEEILGLNTHKDFEKVDDGKTTEHFKSNAILKDIENYPVWNTVPDNMKATKFTLGRQFTNAEILILRKVKLVNHTYFKFSYNNQIIGWIDKEATKLTPDTTIEEKDLNKIAKLVRPNGNSIWSKPYKVDGVTKVSSSIDYKNVVVEIDKEAETQHGVYNRILINNTVIGWIDKSALAIIENCTINEVTSSFDKVRIHFLRKIIKYNNDKNNKGFIDNIENRTLLEENIRKRMFAKISNVENHTIWTKAYPNFNAKRVESAKAFEGEFVKINTINKTRKGTYYQFSIDNKIIGWLDSKAFEIVDGPTVINERQVSLIAELNLGKTDSIWTKPYGLKGARRILKNANLNGEIVKVDKEVTTQRSIYSHIIKNEVPLGWVDNRALKGIELLGMEVDNRFIPEPSKEDINFVNMGRLSPEKGQDNLIQAFAAFHKNNHNSKLYILGQGPLKEELQGLIDRLNINDSVHLLGQLENPFSFMKKCDCFVLSSHYEGQPMVLLEAMTLGMKIIATDIVANRTVLEDGKYGLLVENSITGLENGFNYLVNNEDQFIKDQFNFNIYNSLAMKSFYKCLEGEIV